MAVACNGSAIDNGGDQEMLFGKKGPATEDRYAPALRTRLERGNAFPVAVARGNSGRQCGRYRATGGTPVFEPAANAVLETGDTAYIAQGDDAGATVAIRNTPDMTFEIWSLGPGLAARERLERGRLKPQEDGWIGAYVVGAACLPASRMLLAIDYYDPRVNHALYVYDIVANRFDFLAAADHAMGDQYRYFDVLDAGPDAALALYYTDRTRQSAEIYHNYYNHILLFSARYPAGLELLTLGIDTGNVIDWQLNGNTLWLKTIDPRKSGTAPENYWSLDLADVLTP